MPEPLRIPAREHALWRGDATVGSEMVKRPFNPSVHPWGPSGGTPEQYSQPDMDLFLQRYGAPGATPADRLKFYDDYNPAADFGENANTVPELLRIAIAAGHYGSTDLVLTAEAIGDARFLVPKGTDFWRFQGKPPQPDPEPEPKPKPEPGPRPLTRNEVQALAAEVVDARLAVLLEAEKTTAMPPWARRLRDRLIAEVRPE